MNLMAEMLVHLSLRVHVVSSFTWRHRFHLAIRTLCATNMAGNTTIGMPAYRIEQQQPNLNQKKYHCPRSLLRVGE